MRGFFCQVTDQSILIRKEIGASRREVFWGTNWLTLNLAVAHFFCVLVPSSSFSLYSFIIYGELFGCFTRAKNFSVAFEILPGIMSNKQDILSGKDELQRRPAEHSRVKPSGVDASNILTEGSIRSRPPTAVINVGGGKDGDEYSSGFEPPTPPRLGMRAILAPSNPASPLRRLRTGLRVYKIPWPISWAL